MHKRPSCDISRDSCLALQYHGKFCSKALPQQPEDAEACIGVVDVWAQSQMCMYAGVDPPKSKQKSTVEQVNNNAPVYTVPGVRTIQPRASPVQTRAAPVSRFAIGWSLLDVLIRSMTRDVKG